MSRALRIKRDLPGRNHIEHEAGAAALLTLVLPIFSSPFCISSYLWQKKDIIVFTSLGVTDTLAAPS